MQGVGFASQEINKSRSSTCEILFRYIVVMHAIYKLIYVDMSIFNRVGN
jgi:hypothetical protein